MLPLLVKPALGTKVVLGQEGMGHNRFWGVWSSSLSRSGSTSRAAACSLSLSSLHMAQRWFWDKRVWDTVGFGESGPAHSAGLVAPPELRHAPSPCQACSWHKEVWDTMGFGGVWSSSFSRSGNTSELLRAPSPCQACSWHFTHKRYEIGGMGHNTFSRKRDLTSARCHRHRAPLRWISKC